MKKIPIFIFFFFTAFYLINSQGIQRLAEKVKNNISLFFENRHNITYTVSRFDNTSSLSDLELQRLYHLIVTPLENSGNGIFKDLLTGFNNSKGNFDLSRINEVTHLITIKLINNMGNLGAGIIIYNRNNNRIENIKYFEEQILKPEFDLLGVDDPGLSSFEYKKELDMKIDKKVLNISSIQIESTQYIFILLENKIDIYVLNGNSIKKKHTHNIEWGRPYYPAINPEGDLFIFRDKENVYLSAGSNFSKFTNIYKFANSMLTKTAKLDFSVRDMFQLNSVTYLAGFNFSFGKNFYKGKLYLKQFNSEDIKAGETFIKDLPDFYSSSFYKEGEEFKSLYLIDLNYKLRVFSDSINEVPGEDKKFGSAITVMNDYLALSDYSETNDNLKVLKIGDLIGNPIFSKEIKGEIKVIEKGIINEKSGFWVIVEDKREGLRGSRIQFWRKNID